MNIISKIRNKLTYRNKTISDNAPSWVRLQFDTRPQLGWHIEVPTPDGEVNVYEIQLDTISPNMIYSSWELVATYMFTYHPSKKQYNKLINYQKELV